MSQQARARHAEATTLVGLPVVTLGGDDVAEVRDVVFGSGAAEVHGFTLRKRGWLGRRMREVLPAGAVHSVGRDAVMIEDATVLEQPTEAPEPLEEARGERDVVGAPVVTEAGRQLGTVADLVVRLGDRIRVVGYRLEGNVDHRDGAQSFVPLPDQTAVSGDALIVPEGFDELEYSTLAELDRAESSPTDSRNGIAATRDELYEEAKERDIPGRSSMTKDELAQALEDSADDT